MGRRGSRRVNSSTGEQNHNGSSDAVLPDDGNGDVIKTDKTDRANVSPTATPIPTPTSRGPPKKRESKTRVSQPPPSTTDNENDADDDADRSSDDQEYEVEEILDSKRVRGKIHFLIRWKGYQPESDTWEPENTLSCPDLIAKFLEKQPGIKRKAKLGPKGVKKAKFAKKIAPLKKHFDYENADENEEYEVEKILEVHHKKNGRREFLIHWKGWAATHDTWEPEENLNCPDLIKRFMAKVKEKKDTTTRDLRVAPQATQRFTLSSKDRGRRLSKRTINKQRVRYDNAE